MSIYKKLLEIQKAINNITKDEKAGGSSYGYKYVSGSNLLEKIKPLMNEQGLILKQEVIEIESERIDYQVKSGTKAEMLYKGKLKFTWIDAETGEKDENLFFSAGMNDWEKGAGSLLTYAERYFLLKYFHIATDEDDPDKLVKRYEPFKKKEQPKTPNKEVAQEKVSVDNKETKKEKAIKMITESIKEEDDMFLETLLQDMGKKHLGECEEAELKTIYMKLKERHAA